MRSPESPEVKLMSRQCDMKARCSQGNTREAPEGFDLLSVISSSLLFCLLSSSCACQDETLAGSCCTCVSATSDTCVSEGCPFFFPSCLSACLAPFDFSAKGTHNASPSLCEQVEQDQQLQCQTRNSSITTSGCHRQQKCAQKRCRRVDRTETRQIFAKEKKRKGEKGHRGTDFSRPRQIFAKEKNAKARKGTGVQIFHARCLFAPPGGRNTRKTPNFRKREKTQSRERAQGYRFFAPDAFSHRPAEETPERRQIFAKEKNAKAKKGTGVQIFYAKCLLAPPGGRNTRKTPNFRKREKRKGEKGHRGTDFLRQMPFRTARRTKHPKDAKFSQRKKTQRRNTATQRKRM